MIFHLSGGFKAMIPYYIVLAELLRPLCVEVQAKMLWQGNRVHAEVPLRRVNPADVKAELLGRTGGPQIADPQYSGGFLYNNFGLNDLGDMVLELLT